VTDTDFPKIISFNAPTINGGCTNPSFHYAVDQSNITSSVSKYDIVDVKPNTNEIILNMLDVDTLPGEYNITIQVNHPDSKNYLTSNFWFTLRILAGIC
jgi:hypothetical protein